MHYSLFVLYLLNHYYSNNDLENLVVGGASITPVKLYDIYSDSYSIGQYLGGAIDLDLYAGFIIEYGYTLNGYRKSDILLGSMKDMFAMLQFHTFENQYYFLGVRITSDGLYIENQYSTPKVYLYSIYGILK